MNKRTTNKSNPINSNLTAYNDFIHLKSVFEASFGNAAWMELKDYSSTKEWRKWVVVALKSLAISANESILQADEEWKTEFSAIINESINRAKTASAVNELISIFAADLLQISYHLIGQIPSRGVIRNNPLTPKNWKLNSVRSLTYIQSKPQIDNQYFKKLRKQIGVNDASEIFRIYEKEKQNITFESWHKQKLIRETNEERNKNCP